MRILFLSNVFPNALAGGKGTFNLSLMQALAERHDVHVVSPVSWLDELAARLQGRRLLRRASETPAGRLTVEYPRYYYPPKLFRERSGDFLWWSLHPTLSERLQHFRPDAVVSYWAHPDGEVAVRAARQAGVPAIVMVGGSDVLLLARRGRRRRAILNVLHAADAVVAVSHHLARQLHADGIPPEKVHVVHRGVNRQVFSPGDRRAARERLGLPLDRPVFVAVGRLVPVKGFDLLLDSCRRLAASGRNFECHILGGGPLEPALRSGIARVGLANHVCLHGAQSQTRLADWYRAADLTLLTSHSEGIPNVLLESLCCGTPFVATRVGGVPEIVDEVCDRLVAPGDAAAFAAAISERLAAVAVPAQRRFSPPSWEESAGRLADIIEACRGPGAGDSAAPVEFSNPKTALCVGA